MKWLEVIHLRTGSHDQEGLEGLLEQIVGDIREEEGGGTISLFRRVGLETDICLQLQNESEEVELAGSSLGMHLAMTLKKFGWVNHTVWVADGQERVGNRPGSTRKEEKVVAGQPEEKRV